jgi:hypothetical protein
VPQADPALDAPSGLGERQPDAPPVGRVGAPLDEAPFGQPVHHAGQSRLAEQNMPVQLTNAQWFVALGQRVEHVVLPQGQLLPDVLSRESLQQVGVR